MLDDYSPWPRKLSAWRSWLPRMLIEALVVVGSILFALAVDEWNQGKDFDELAQRSLVAFDREIRQNLVRLEDATPFHLGLRDVLDNMGTAESPASMHTFRDIIDGFAPTILVSTAWETGVATGALNHMDYDVVAALSLTYGIQERLGELNRSGMSELVRGRSEAGDMEMLLYAASRYLRDLAEEEQQLRIAYVQVLELLEDAVVSPVAPPARARTLVLGTP
jgi:hypothetical protein